MQFKDRTKSGMITIEFAFGILSAVVVLFIVMGSFNGNMGKMFINSNLQKIANESITRTNYTSYGRSYENSTIYVK